MRPTLRLLLCLALPAAATAQVVNPADKQQQPNPRPSAPPIIVEGRQVSDFREEDRIGSYQQPEWTSHRRFAETRIYVRPEGTVEFEYWLIPEIPDGGGSAETKVQYELEFGLPGRFQLDLYVVSHEQGNDGPMEFDEQKVEVRHAFADWDEIWGNPTGYLEWSARNNEPDHIEAKLLFGGEMCPGWHWGTNLVYEQETGGLRESAYELTGGVSRTICDQRFSAGLEVKWAMINDSTDRSDFANEVLLGPSFQYRPSPNSHIDVAPLVGLTDESPDAKVTMLFGWEF